MSDAVPSPTPSPAAARGGRPESPESPTILPISATSPRPLRHVALQYDVTGHERIIFVGQRWMAADVELAGAPGEVFADPNRPGEAALILAVDADTGEVLIPVAASTRAGLPARAARSTGTR